MSTTHGRTRITGIKSLLNHPDVRRLERDGRTLYAAVDLVAVLTDSQHAAEQWADIKRHDSAIDAATETASVGEQIVDVLPLQGVPRLVQSLSSSKAEKLKNWMAAVATRALEEEDNPELALLRTRSLYQNRGYSRRWIDQRMRSVSARQELTSEWYRRGSRESEQFRQLTNALISGTFGLEVEAYRQLKGLGGTRENLRDHMTDMELALTSLAEATTVSLLREKNDTDFDSLLADTKAAAAIVGGTREQIEEVSGRAVVFAGNHLAGRAPRGPRGPNNPEDRRIRRQRHPGSDAAGETTDAIALPRISPKAA